MVSERSFYIGSFCVTVHFLAVISFAALIIAQARYSCIALMCAAIHELGHVCLAKLCGARVYGISFLPFGAELKTAGCKSYYKEIAVCLGGPLFNLMAGAIFFVLFIAFPCEELIFCTICCGFLMLVNMVPACGLDGGNAVKYFLLCRMEQKRAENIVNFIQLCALILLSFVAAVTATLSNFNLSVTVICAYLFVQTLMRKNG